MTQFSRRNFIQILAAGAATAAVSGCLPTRLAEFQQPPAPQAATARESTWVPTVCRICPAGCGVLARLVDGRVVKIEGNPAHPLNQGKPCPRAQAALQVLYDPDRVQGPRQRVGERGEGRWERTSWREVIPQLTGRLAELREEGEAHRLVFLHDAPPGHMRELIERFCQAYGSPNAISGDEWQGERLAHLLTQGWSELAAHDWEETDYVLFFGGSFLEDWQPLTQMLRAYSYLRRGRPDRRARMVQIGPRYSISAVKADEWVPILPGRQGALALGMAHVIIRERLYDHAFVADHTEGFTDLAALVQAQYSPDQVTGLTGVPVEIIKRLAREFAGSRPAIAVAGRGLAEGTNELFNQVAIHALNALAGSIDVPGGIVRPASPPFTPYRPAAPEPAALPLLDGAGSARYPLAGGAFHTLPERILEGDPYLPEVLFLYETNPLFEGAGADRWRQTLARIPLVVSFSSFMDETALYADLVLPNHTFLERWEDGTATGGSSVPAVGIGRPVVSPRYNTRHTAHVLLGLARGLGGEMATYLPWSSHEELLRFRAEGLFRAGGSIQAESYDAFWQQLVERGVWVGARHAFGRWDEALATRSGRFQFRLDGLEQALSDRGLSGATLGLAAAEDELALPHFEPPQFAGDSQTYPFHLVPYQVAVHAGSRAPNSPLLWELYGLQLKEMWHNWAELHPETAHRLGIRDGDEVWVESPQGRIRLKARLFEGAMPDVVSIPVGGGHTAGGRWASQVGGGNVAELVVPQTDPVCGAVAWCGTRVRIARADSRS